MTSETVASDCISPSDEVRYISYFHELDAWTEYWDVYHRETRGRYYFGNGADEPGLLTRLLPRASVPAVFLYWKRCALYEDAEDRFNCEVRTPSVSEAVLELDALEARVFHQHFGDASRDAVRIDYLRAIHRFAIDAFPEARDRDALIAPDDPRKATAGRHALDGDLMWFAWALCLEAVSLLPGQDESWARLALLMAGVATGCSADFAWRGHRRTRKDYKADEATANLLRARGLDWARNFNSGAAEVRALFRIREWGEP